MSNSKSPEYLETRSIGRLLAEFTMPAVLATVISAVYNLIARIFVGHKFGMTGVAALTISFPVMLIMLAFAMMIGTGGTTLLSIHLGEKRNDEAERVLGQSLFMYIFCAVLFMVFGLIWLDELLLLFGASAEVLPLARDYMKVILWGVIFQEIAFGVNNFIRAEGRPRVAVVSVSIAVPINLFLTWLFLFKLNWGMAGAGWAMVISQGFSSLWVCYYYLSGGTILRWRLKYFRPNFALMWKICLFGTVPLVAQACSALLQGVQCNILGYYGNLCGVKAGLVGINGGDLAVGIMGTIFVICMLMVMPMLGLSQGMQPIVGYNVGAARPDRVRRVLTLGLYVGAVFGLLFWLLGILAPEYLLLFFVGKDDPAFVQTMLWGRRAVTIVLLSSPFVGVTIVASGYFQAHGRPILSLMLSLLRQLIFLLPLLILLPWLSWEWSIGNSLDACWLAYPLSDSLAFICTFLFLVREYRLKHQAVIQMHKSHGQHNNPTDSHIVVP